MDTAAATAATAATTTLSSPGETSTRAVIRHHGCSNRVAMVVESSSPSCVFSHDSAAEQRGTVLKSILAGYAAGISGTLVGHPFDSAKVWLQTQQSCKSTAITPAPTNHTAAAESTTTTTTTTTTSGSHTARNAGTTSYAHHSSRAATTNNNNNTSRTVHTGTLAVSSRSSRYRNSACIVPRATTVFAQQLRAFYAGVTGPLLTVGLVQSINFAIFDSVRRILWHRQQQQQQRQPHNHTNNNDYLYHDSLTNVAISSSVAGAVLAFFTSPMLMIKTQQQTMAGLTFRQALKQTIMQHSGPGRMFVGFAPHFLAETAGRAVYFCSYEALKRSFLVQKQQHQRQQHCAEHGNASTATTTTCSLHQRMISAALSGILCWSLIFPLDALRCRMYAQQVTTNAAATSTTTTTTVSSSSLSRNTVQTAQHMYNTGGGIKAFYRGFGVTVVRAGPVAAAVLPVYDWALEQLSSI